jgi:hypothetical protein
MPIDGGYFSSKIIAGSYDREYGSQDYQRRWADNIRDGIAVAESVVITTQNEVSKVADTMDTSVAVGAGWIQGLYYYIDTTPIAVTHEAADPTNDRIDRIVIEANTNELVRSFIIKSITGTPAASPVAPALTREDILTGEGAYQISLAQILIPANVSTLNTATVTDERSDSTLCGIAKVKLGIDPPSGSDASSIVVDDSGLVILTGTDQQTVDESADAELALNRASIEILADTGTADNVAVTTYASYDQTKSNWLHFVPAFNNTGAGGITITAGVTAGTTLALKVIDADTGLPVDPDADVLVAGKVISGYPSGPNFILTPSGGANPMDDWLSATSAADGEDTGGVLTSRVSVSGRGWITAIFNGDLAANFFSIKIDGVDFIGTVSTGGRLICEGYAGNLIMARFESSFEVLSGNAGRTYVSYVLGDKLDEAIPKLFSDNSDVSCPNTLINVTGEGWFYGGNSRNFGTQLEVDGTTLLAGKLMGHFDCLFKFSSSFKILSSTYFGASNQNYYTYTLL